jgi:hypothetical protein
METQEKEKTVLSEGVIKGRWKLSYSLVNNNGIAGFSGRMIGPYRDPFTGKQRFLYNANGDRLLGFSIEKVEMDFNPEFNPDDRLAIDWLVGHPEVGVTNDQVRLNKQYLSRKISNPRIKLINLDHQDIRELVEEDFVDKLIGLISLDNGKNALGIEKLRFVLSKLNLSYREEKLINDPTIEKQKLRQRLKTYTRASYEHAKEVGKIMEDLNGAQFVYEIKEMERLKIIKKSNATYMYEGNPLATSYEGLRLYFENQPEFYAELSGKLYEALKSQ